MSRIRVVIVEDVVRCVDPGKRTRDSHKSCLKIEAALRHIAEAEELVKNDLHAMNYSNFCVRFASHLIFNEFRNELER